MTCGSSRGRRDRPPSISRTASGSTASMPPSFPAGDGVASDLPPPINAFATAAVNEVRRIHEWTEPDLVFAPLWDVEAIGVLRETDLPVAIHVSTPALITGTMAGFLRNDATDPPELRRLLEVEAEVMHTADLFQANTDAVMDTIRRELRRALCRRPLAGCQHRLARSGCEPRPMSGRTAVGRSSSAASSRGRASTRCSRRWSESSRATPI